MTERPYSSFQELCVVADRFIDLIGHQPNYNLEALERHMRDRAKQYQTINLGKCMCLKMAGFAKMVRSKP